MNKRFAAAFLICMLSACVLFAQNTVPPVADATDLAGAAKRTIIIDPGHGGGEWGVSANGLQEKAAMLKIAVLVKKKIEKSDKTINVLLTRSADEYIKEPDRAGFANSKKGDLYVSIHCDYLAQEKISGYKIYYTSAGEKPAGSDAVIKWGDVQKTHEAENKKAAEIMNQYLQAALMAEPGAATQENDVLTLPTRGIASVPLYTVNGINMPAIVIETCNINNKQDASAIKDDRVVSRLAYHITEGILNYLKDANSRNGFGESK